MCLSPFVVAQPSLLAPDAQGVKYGGRAETLRAHPVSTAVFFSYCEVDLSV